MAISEQISEFLVETKLKDIPEETIEFTKQLALKTLAGMLAGSLTTAGRKITSIIQNQRGPDEATVIGCGFKTSVESAVLANGLFAHAAELEDDQFPSATSDITIFPVIFPLADKLRSTGREIVEAAALSMEAMNRVGMFPTAHMGIAEIAFYGVLGSAAAAGKILGLNSGEMRSALGIALGRAGGFSVNFGTDAHYLETACACRDGLVAAMLAKDGLTGNADFEKWLSGILGAEKVELQRIVRNLGQPKWHVHNIWIKKYPCCFLTHRQNDVLFAIIRENNLTYDKIDRIDIDVGTLDAICNRPNPKDVEDSRFSFQHIQAGIMLEGDLNFDTFTDDKIASPLFKEARSKVRVHTHTDWPATWMSGPGKVSLITKDGRTFSKEMEQPIGGSKLPLTSEQFKELYYKYTKGILSEEQIEWTAKIILNLEKVKDLREFMDVITYRYVAKR
jgi:2-methylcitrate dehydratase PrpD